MSSIKLSLPSLLAARNLQNVLTNNLNKKFYEKFRIIEANVGNDFQEQYKR
jgi:hypothetical protein